MREVEKIKQKANRFSLCAISAVSVYLMAYALFSPEKTMAALLAALALFVKKVLPSLAMFSVCAKLLVKSGAAEMLSFLPIGRLCFSLGVSRGGFAAFLIGSFAGFPTGAAVLSELCERGSISRREAESLLPFCNQAGASFVIGTVGAAFFEDTEKGLLLFAAQFLSSLIGVCATSGARLPYLFSNGNVSVKRESLPRILTSAVSESASAMLSVCGYVVFFSVSTAVLFDTLTAFRIVLPGSPAAVLSGVLELSSGLSRIPSAALSESAAVSLAGALLGFGGISVYLQAADRAETLSLSRYLPSKLWTALLCGGIAFLFYTVFERYKNIFFVIFLCIFMAFFALLLNFLKNKVFFKKVWKNRKECCII